MQIKEGGLLGGSLKAVISFECSSESTGDIKHMTVLDSDYVCISVRHIDGEERRLRREEERIEEDRGEAEGVI